MGQRQVSVDEMIIVELNRQFFQTNDMLKDYSERLEAADAEIIRLKEELTKLKNPGAVVESDLEEKE